LPPQESRFGILIEAHNRARAALAEAERQVKQLQTTTDGAAGSTAKMNRASEAMGRALGAVRRDVEGAAAGMSRFGGVLTSVGGVVGGLALGITGLAGGMLLLARNAGNAQEEMDNITERTGLAAQTVGALKIAAAEAGLSFQQLSPGLDLFNRKIGEAVQGDEKAIETFKDLGVTLRDEVTGALKSTDQLLEDTAAALNGIAEPSERTRLAMETFGRSGSRFITALSADMEENRKRAEELGLVWGEDLANVARSVDSSFDRMGTAMEGLGKSLAAIAAVSLEGLVGQIADLAEWLARAAKHASDLFSRLPKTDKENAALTRAGLVMTPQGPQRRVDAEAAARGDFSSWQFKNTQAALGIPSVGTTWPMPGPPMPTAEQWQEMARLSGGGSGSSGPDVWNPARDLQNDAVVRSWPGFGAIRSLGNVNIGGMVADTDLKDRVNFQGVDSAFMKWMEQFEDYHQTLEDTKDAQGMVNENGAAFLAVLTETDAGWMKAANAARLFKDGIESATLEVIKGTKNIGEAFGQMIEDVLAKLAAAEIADLASGALGQIFGPIGALFSSGGKVAYAASGMTVQGGGVRGFDGIPTLTQPGERWLSVHKNDQFEHMVNRIDAALSRGGSLGSASRTVIANFHFNVSQHSNRAEARRYVRETIGPEVVDYLMGLG
jgi:hypothetical protein